MNCSELSSEGWKNSQENDPFFHFHLRTGIYFMFLIGHPRFLSALKLRLELDLSAYCGKIQLSHTTSIAMWVKTAKHSLRFHSLNPYSLTVVGCDSKLGKNCISFKCRLTSNLCKTRLHTYGLWCEFKPSIHQFENCFKRRRTPMKNCLNRN
jgi:hypothetical protein